MFYPILRFIPTPLQAVILFSALYPQLILAQPESHSPLQFGPLIHQFPLTLESGIRTEALGPLISYELKENAFQWAFHPVVSYDQDRDTDFTEFDFLYPVITLNRFGPEYRFQIFQLFSFSGGESIDEEKTSRFTLFPLIFYQRSEDPDRNYAALFPLYGRLKNRLFMDEIQFVLFPAYLETRKREVSTKQFLFPFFHVRRGPGLDGWKFWPLVGSEEKEVTTRTNTLGEEEIVGGHEKLFVLWPFYFNNKLGIGTDNPLDQHLLLPLFALQRSPLRDTSSFLWPIGFTYTVDREKNFREWGMPWPLIVFARGDKTINRVWPLFSQAKNPVRESNFYLWPLYHYDRITSSPLDRQRTRVLFFLYSEVVERNTVTGTALERTDLWPLFTTRRDHAGNERFQMLSILEPFFPGNKSIERNYSHIWSIWRSEKNAATGASSRSLLWNLYRSDATPETRTYSFLFGLFRYQSGPEGRRWRIFYIPFGENPV